MRDLTPVRLSGAGALLVLTDGSGVEYAVPVASVRETLGRAGAAPAPTIPEPRSRGKEPTMESSLRPRDIQSRIRAGESAEDVAAVAGTSVEKVMIFASPVLAERAHVAAIAESATVRRASTDPTSPAVATTRTLGAAVAGRLRERGVDPASVAWDAWRREDGRWTLQAGYAHDAEEREARFSYDQRGHFVSADDDDARWLVGDGQVPARAVPAAPAPRQPVDTRATRPLRLAPPPVDHDPLGDDALDLFSADMVSADADWMSTVSQPDPTPETHPGTAPGGSPDADPDPGAVDPAAPVDEPMPGETPPEESPHDRESLARTTQSPTTPAGEPRRTPRPAAKKARGRASVPSWDEIMFGGGK